MRTKNFLKKIIILSVFTIIIGCTDKSEYADQTLSNVNEPPALTPDSRIRYGTLDNGMNYAIVENTTPEKKVALRLVFNVGWLAEDDDQIQVAHFLEHMNFNGTSNVPEGEMIPLLEREGLAFGPDTNAFTGDQLTGYELALPDNSEQLIKIGLFLMRETASEIVFDQGAIDREEGIIISEGRARNTPVQRFWHEYFAFLYPGTRVARPTFPPDEYIAALTADKFQRFYDDFYVPQRALLVVVGDVNADQIEQKITQGFDISIPGLDVSSVESFNAWQQPDNAPQPDFGEFTVPDLPKFGIFIDPELYTIITLNHQTKGKKKADSRATRKEELLIQLGNSIVQRRITSEINAGKSPLIQFSPSYSNNYNEINSAGILAIADPQRWQDGVAIVEQSIRQALKHGFNQSELNEQLANMRTSLQDAADQMATTDSDRFASVIFQSWLNERVLVSPDFALQWFNEIESSLTLEEVENAFANAWSGSPPAVFLTNSAEIEGGVEALKSAWESSQQQQVAAVEDVGEIAFAYADVGQSSGVISSQLDEDLNFAQVKYANGVTLNVKTTDFEEKVIYVRADFGAGNLNPQTAPAASTITPSIFITGGLEAHNYDDIQRALVGKSTSVNLSVQEDSFVLSGASTPDDIELQLQLMTAYLTAPGFREESLTRFKSISTEVRRQQSSATTSTVVNTVYRMLRNGDTRWGFPTKEEVANFSLDKAIEYITPALKRAPIEVTIVGDITVEKAIELVGTTFGALAPRDDQFPSYKENANISFPATGQEIAIVEFNGQPNQAMANTFYKTTSGDSARDRRTLQLLASIIRLKALDVLREELGATYSPIVSSQPSRVFNDYGFMWLGVDVTPDTLEDAYRTSEQIIASVREGNISQDELLRVRQPILESLEQDMQNNRAWLSRLANTQRTPELLADFKSIKSDYETITLDEIVNAAKVYLTADRAYRVTLRAAEQ